MHQHAQVFLLLFCSVSFATVGIELMASHMVGQHFITDPYYLLLFLPEAGSHSIAQPGLEFSMEPKLALNSQQASFIHIPTAVITRTGQLCLLKLIDLWLLLLFSGLAIKPCAC